MGPDNQSVQPSFTGCGDCSATTTPATEIGGLDAIPIERRSQEGLGVFYPEPSSPSTIPESWGQDNNNNSSSTGAIASTLSFAGLYDDERRGREHYVGHVAGPLGPSARLGGHVWRRCHLRPVSQFSRWAPVARSTIHDGLPEPANRALVGLCGGTRGSSDGEDAVSDAQRWTEQLAASASSPPRLSPIAQWPSP